MRVDRARATKAFSEYISHYDVSENKIRLKMEHTNRVSRLCEQIAQEIGLLQEDVDTAWLLGLLHDVGRFEQVRRYGTFQDSISVDHAGFGADILFREGHIRDYVEDTSEDALLETAIRAHSAYRIPEGLSEREQIFCNILRDADKIDIIRVNTEYTLEEIYNVSTEELEQAAVTPEVMQAFRDGHAILRSLKRTPVDNVIGHISLVYELVYPVSRRMLIEQGFFEKLTDFHSKNPETAEQIRKMREHLYEQGYLRHGIRHTLISRKSVRKNRFMKGNQWEDHWNHRHIKATVIKHDLPKAKLGKVVRLRQHKEVVDCTSQICEADFCDDAFMQPTEIEQLLQEIRESHICGRGGAAFDTAEKIEAVQHAAAGQRILLINGVSCDPGLLQDDWLMLHHRKEIEIGIGLLVHAMEFQRVILAVRQPYEIHLPAVELQIVPNRYPMGAEKLLLRTIGGIQYDQEKRPAEQGILVLNVQTVFAVCQAHVRPEQSSGRYITAADLHTGIAAIARVDNGQSVYDTIQKVFGDQPDKGDRFYYGGGILSAEEASEDSVIDNGVCFIAFGNQVQHSEDQKCGGCGICARKCPMKIEVYKAVQALEKGKKPPVTKEQAASCLQCGTCSYYCRAGKDTMEIIRSLRL